MKIAIAGVGEVGLFYAEPWIAAGHRVTFTHARDHEAAARRVAVLGPQAHYVRSLEARTDPEVVVLAARLEALDDAFAALGPLRDVVLMDAVNPFTPDRSGLVDLGGRTAADVVASALADYADVRHVKALHSDGVQRIKDSAHPVALFVAGDDPAAIGVAEGLIVDAGLVPVATGPLATAAWSEPPGVLFGQGFDGPAAERALAAVREESR